MATHSSHSDSKSKRGSTPFFKIFAPILGILILVVVSLYGIKAMLPHPEQNRDAAKLIDKEIIKSLPLTQLGGKTLKISDLKAKVYLLNFWATWCEACIEEMPSIVQLREAYHDRGFEVLGVNLDENPEVVVPKTAQQFKINFPILIDPDNKLAEIFDVHAIPLTAILRKDHEPVIVNGGRDWNSDEVRKQLEQWLAE